MQQSRLSGIIQTEEQEFGMLVQESQRRKSIPDCGKMKVSVLSLKRLSLAFGDFPEDLLTPVDNPHLGYLLVRSRSWYSVRARVLFGW
jgi:hypothetical protein